MFNLKSTFNYVCYVKQKIQKPEIKKKSDKTKSFSDFAKEKLTILEADFQKRNKRKTLHNFLNGASFGEADEQLFARYKNSLEAQFMVKEIIEKKTKLISVKEKIENESIICMMNLMINRLELFLKNFEEIAFCVTFLHLFIGDLFEDRDLTKDNKIKVFNSFLFFIFQYSSFYNLKFLKLAEKNNTKFESIRNDVIAALIQSILIQTEETIGLDKSKSGVFYSYAVDNKKGLKELQESIIESVMIVFPFGELKKILTFIDDIYVKLDSNDNNEDNYKYVMDGYFRYFGFSSLCSIDQLYYSVGFLFTNKKFLSNMNLKYNGKKGFFEFFENKYNKTIYQTENINLIIYAILEFRINVNLLRYFSAYKKNKRFNFEKIAKILSSFKYEEEQE